MSKYRSESLTSPLELDAEKENISGVQRLFDVLPIPLLIIDSENVIHKLNAAAHKLIGGSLEECVGKPVQIKSENGLSAEQRVRFPNGKEIIAEVSFTPVVWEGLPVRVLSVQDISTHMQVKKELLEEREGFRTLIDYTYDWECWLQPDRKLVYVSPACKRITGY